MIKCFAALLLNNCVLNLSTTVSIDKISFSYLGAVTVFTLFVLSNVQNIVGTGDHILWLWLLLLLLSSTLIATTTYEINNDNTITNEPATENPMLIHSLQEMDAEQRSRAMSTSVKEIAQKTLTELKQRFNNEWSFKVIFK